MKKTILFILAVVFLIFSCKTGPETEDSAAKSAETSEAADQEIYDDMPVIDAVETLVGSGDYAAAAEQMSRLSEEERNEEDSVLLYSSLLISSGEYDKAGTELDSILEKDAENVEALFNKAIIEGINGDMDAQLTILKQILEIDPENSLAQAATGDFYLANRRYNQAKKYFQTSLEIDSENAYAQLGMGRTLLVQGETEAAMEYLNIAAENDSENALVYAERARANTELSDYIKADEDLTTAIEIMPDYYWFYIDRGKLRQTMMGNYRTALEDFNAAIELKPDYFYAYLYRAQINDAVKDYETALSDYEYVLENKPDYYYAYVPVAILYYFDQRWDDAALYFQKAYSIEQDDGFALMAGMCGLRGSNPAESEKFIQNYIGKKSRESAFYHVGRAMIEKGYDGYALHYITISADKKERASALFYLAALYQNFGNPSLAVKYYEEVRESEQIGLMEYKLAEYELEKAGINK